MVGLDARLGRLVALAGRLWALVLRSAGHWGPFWHVLALGGLGERRAGNPEGRASGVQGPSEAVFNNTQY